MTSISEEFAALLKATTNRLGTSAAADFDEVRIYAADRMRHLATVIGENGYHEALQAEAANVALKAAGAAVTNADALDREFVGIVTGGLAIGARAIAGTA